MRIPLLLIVMTAGACAWNAAGKTGCRPLGPALALPEVLRETSGLAWSRVRDGVLFSHNDGGHPALVYALDLEGSVLGEIPLSQAENRDWEDIAAAPCGDDACIYVADTGDNQEVRDSIFLIRIRDTGTYDGSPQTADVFPMVLPDGPRDMESVFVLPGEEVFFLTKGRNDPVTLYRYPPPLRPGETVTLEAVQTLSEGALPLPQQITGADVSWDGSVVAIRSYEDLSFFQWKDGQLTPVDGGQVDLRTLNEVQGEAVALGPNGEVALSSEEALGRPATLSALTCSMPLGSTGSR